MCPTNTKSDNPQGSRCTKKSIESCFGAICEVEQGKKYIQAIADAQSHIEVVMSWFQFKEFCTDFEGELKAALKRDVALRFVAEKPASEQLPRWISPRLPRYRFELRILMNPPDASVTIIDGKQAVIAYDKNLPFAQTADLWTKHPALIALSQVYFYREWGSSRR